MIKVKHPYAEDEELYLVRCAIKFGRFSLMCFQTLSDRLKEDLDTYCVERGYTPGWSSCPLTGYYTMTKTPMAMLIHLLAAQPNDGLHSFEGAWKINMSSDCTAVNVITNCSRASDGTLCIDKLTQFYPYAMPMHTQAYLCEPSFRTSIFKVSINEARRLLHSISFDGIVVNAYEDTVYTASHLPPDQKLRIIGEFVQYMLNNHKEVLQESFTGDHETLLEDEFALMQEFCAPKSDSSTRKIFAVSVLRIANQYQVEPYPKRCTSAVKKAIDKARVKYPNQPFAKCLDETGQFKNTVNQLQLWIDDTWEPTNYYGGYVKFIPCPSTSMVCGFQATKKGGLRMVFMVSVKEGDTTYPSPVDGTPLPIPSHVYENQEERAQWYWHPHRLVNTGTMLSQYRKLSPADWCPYQNDVSAELETMYQAGDVTCDVLIGAVSLQICLKPGNLSTREMGVQKHGDREHFVKRMIITSQDYERKMQAYNDDLRTKQTHALGNKNECAICLESLTDSKCVLLHCNHLMHALCLQAHVEANGATCPVCKASTTSANTTDATNVYENVYRARS